MRIGCPLDNRSGYAKLPKAASAGALGAATSVTQALPRGDGFAGWRTVELWAADYMPWEALVEWSGGRAGNRKAMLVVSGGATRICVDAITVNVTGYNLSPTVDVTAWAAIEDGYGQYKNQWVARGSTSGIGFSGNVSIGCPPWAEFVRVEISDPTQYALVQIDLIDAGAVIRASYAGDGQPNPGIPVGDAVTISATIPAGLNYRITFLLGL